MPTLMVMMMTRFFGARRSWTEGLSVVPFTIFGGLSFTLPYVAAAYLLGPVFPSLLGSLVGLLIVTSTARRGFLIPKDRWDFSAAATWPRVSASVSARCFRKSRCSGRIFSARPSMRAAHRSIYRPSSSCWRWWPRSSCTAWTGREWEGGGSAIRRIGDPLMP
jgi:hypothetical protein